MLTPCIAACLLVALATPTLSPSSTPTFAPGEQGRKLVFAHRGASAYLPEHTLAAYALAFAQGADYIEPDLVLTKDGVLICSHDLAADATTNAADLFADRKRTDGHVYYSDLTLAEVKSLESRGRRGAARGHTVPTFDEMVQLIQQLNRDLGRDVGILPEMKKPADHRAAGLDIEAALAGALKRHGYTSRDHRCVVQCFELEPLRHLRTELGCQVRMVYLIDKDPGDPALDEAARVVDAIAPSRKAIEREPKAGSNPTPSPPEPTGLAHRIRQRGLALYSWTFKDEPDAMTRFWTAHHCDGLFTDNPDVGVAARNAIASPPAATPGPK